MSRARGTPARGRKRARVFLLEREVAPVASRKMLGLGLAALGSAAGGVYAAARLAFNSGIVRDNYHDYNFDPECDSPDAFSPSGTSPFRISAREGNIWWNSQPLERHTVCSHDGLTLTGHLLYAEKPTDRLALVVHGHKCVSGEMGFISRMYRELGFNVFAPDQRAHGKSDGRYIGMGGLESRDMVAWLKLLSELFPQSRIVMHGISMGASTVITASAQDDLPDNVKCTVEDCGFSDARGSFAYHLQHHLPFLPLKDAILATADLICRVEARYSFNEVSALDAIKSSRTPMLFIHGTTDDVVPFWMQKRLYDAHPREKECLRVEGARHGVSYFADPALYRETVARFVSRFIPAD